MSTTPTLHAAPVGTSGSTTDGRTGSTTDGTGDAAVVPVRGAGGPVRAPDPVGEALVARVSACPPGHPDHDEAVADAVAARLADPVRASENATGMFGTTPADGDWSWLLLVAPHSATPFDLAQTIGSAVLVIALCLLVERLLPRPATAVLAVLFGAGAATLV